MERITGFLDPAATPAAPGFQLIQAKIALGSGGLFGVGLGESLQKAFYLPEAHTDMIAAVIGEELGLLGIALLVGLYGMFGYAGLRIAQNARDRYGKLLAAGLTSLVLVQAMVNLLAVFGLAPLTGVPLPFVSYGNSSMLDARRRRPAAEHRHGGASRVDSRTPSSRGARLRVVDGGRPKASEELVKSRDSSAAEPPGTWCRRWRSPTRYGLRAPRSASSARATAPRPSSCPRPATRSTSCACAGSTAATRCAPPARWRWRRGRCPPRGGVLRERGAEAVLGGGGYVAAPAGLAALPCASRSS